jgi:deoxyadenosine/deoxycytidine kinase
MFVAVAGNIGAGKSSLTQILAERFALEPVFEAVDENPYLADFYADMPRYAFHSQMFFLSKRLEQHVQRVNPGNRVIQDRTLYEDAAVFARNLFDEGILDGRDFRVYTAMYEAIRGRSGHPTCSCTCARGCRRCAATSRCAGAPSRRRLRTLPGAAERALRGVV